MRADNDVRQVDALIIGAGFAGLYALKRLRDQEDLDVHVVEAGDGIGGTWYHNRYPGARCDIESLDYSYSFDEDLQQQWRWSERYATQPELLAYLNHVADRFDLRRDITLNRRVTTAAFDADSARWLVSCDDGTSYECQFLIMATGVLSIPQEPTLPGLSEFSGQWQHSGNWPRDGVDVTGKRVAVIGTGSSGVQMIPLLAEQADELLVFQRTANFTMPAQNRPLDDAADAQWKANYADHRAHARTTYAGSCQPALQRRGAEMTAEQRAEQYARRWDLGGLHMQRAFLDIMRDDLVNNEAADFVRAKIQEIVDDEATADLLTPRGFPLGTKRLCSGTNFYETFNRDNVRLIDAAADPIERITATGIATTHTHHDVDVIVFAIGFHAMTGALQRINPTGRDGVTLAEHWRRGPRSYLGLAIHGFPNMFIIAGPQSPSVLSNMVCSIEQHVEWTADAIAHLRSQGSAMIEADAQAEGEWVQHVNDAADQTLFGHGAASWYYATGEDNTRSFMPYVGGVGPYGERLQEVARSGYVGFTVDGGSGTSDDARRPAEPRLENA